MPPSPVRNRRRARRFVLIAIAALLLLAILVVVLAPPESQVTWLTPAEIAHATKPSPFVTIKRKLINLTAPLWRWYHSSRRSIQISSSFLTLSTAASEQIGLGPSTTTNADGLRAWILSPAELNALQQRLRTLPIASVTASPTVQVADGTPAQVSVLQPINAVDNYMRAGSFIKLIPRAASHSVKLFINATVTEPAAPPLVNGITIKTNFTANCAAIVPNNGGLVLYGGKPDSANAQSYWLIISPMMLDAQGNPIKP